MDPGGDPHSHAVQVGHLDRRRLPVDLGAIDRQKRSLDDQGSRAPCLDLEHQALGLGLEDLDRAAGTLIARPVAGIMGSAADCRAWSP